MATELAGAPVLSTPAEHIFEHVDPEAAPTESQVLNRTDDELRNVYEIERTVKELRNGGRRRVALQFPDSMLGDAPRVLGLLKEALTPTTPDAETGKAAATPASETDDQLERIYILADTSYSACCVDEIAAEHMDADVVVHYGRSCLSPTSRLPVIYVFTKHVLDQDATAAAFEGAYPDKDSRVIVMADVTYQDHVSSLVDTLRTRGYSNLLSTDVVHNPLGSIPNRTVHDQSHAVVEFANASEHTLSEHAIFHIATPPTSLLLILSSKVQSLHIHDVPTTSPSGTANSTRPTRALLGRRYAKVLTLATAGIVGILVNTLSVANYLSSIDSIRKRIAAAGKKSYTVVVGKLNPAKLANFAEIDGWVVVGCWESSLVEDDAGFYRPVVTPFELEVALMSDEERVWGDRWWGGIEGVKDPEVQKTAVEQDGSTAEVESGDQSRETGDWEIDEEESEPPQFDLRTGKFVSRSRPMRAVQAAEKPHDTSTDKSSSTSAALALRPKADLATVNGVVSPGAEFLRSQRTWQGLGTDYDPEEISVPVQEGRSGIARGYTVGEDSDRR